MLCADQASGLAGDDKAAHHVALRLKLLNVLHPPRRRPQRLRPHPWRQRLRPTQLFASAPELAASPTIVQDLAESPRQLEVWLDAIRFGVI